MKRKEWWNKPMTRKNWLVVYIVSISVYLIGLGCIFYADSIKEVVEKWNKQVSDMSTDVKQRF